MTTRPPLYKEELGTLAPTLVFLPGVGGTTRYWRPRVAPLARNHGLLLVDLLGFGKSPKPWIRYTVDRHVAELRRVLGERERFTLVGHSFGAVAAVAYAARHSEQVQGLVLLSLPCFGGLEQAIQYYRRRGGPDRWLMTNVVLAAVTCVVTRRILGRLLPRLLRDMPREVAEDLVQHTWLSSTSTIWEGVYRHDVGRDADRLPPELPVLCLHGDRDVTAPLDYVRRLIAGRPQWTLRVLPDIDHHPLLRDPARCLAAIREFVAPSLPAASTLR
jgi:pimeloyl-ACP methyl ester carboxylesterase